MVLSAGVVLATALTGCQQDDRVVEKVTKARGAYPDRVERPSPGFQVALTTVPLVADNRLRVLDAENRVWAEPLEAPQKTPAYWSYERDETVLTVELAERAGRAPLAVSLWADGGLIAVDTRTGTVAWRAEVGGSISDRWSAFDRYHYDRGGRYADSRLRVVSGDGRPVVLVDVSEAGLIAFDAADGDELWNGDWKCDEPGATSTSWVATHAVVVAEDCYTGVRLLDPRTGKQTAELDPKAPAEWPQAGENGIQAPVLSEYGCVREVCDLLKFQLSGSSGGVEPLYFWIDDKGKAVPLDKDEPTPDAEGLPPEVQTSSEGFVLTATDVAERTTRWHVETPLNTAGLRSFGNVVVTSDVVWVDSKNWKEKGPALLAYDLESGKQTTCRKPPGKAIEDMAAAGDYLVMSDVDIDSESTAEPTFDVDDHPFLMMYPERKSTC
ncbi:PQQ-binding-like beta-propeller repeat protein [Streptomyces sp. ALI-76-A]|uniref:outer membrane protein assembly factor BamB family protein n=1 Tax=Streptomyces sp. ALI-76-A TaxID=3025736 RepID=UPI00256F15C3|nr:PQQ-binding-like beta-propeller repeat protein [Streptomyces sp. ALI-76-A]MDL5199088.1 PQQ-binding-like beta-propeller repeat protein [Streptomyces sp. ALI-76-A]